MKKDIEEKVIKLLENGETLQSSIYRVLDVSKSRVSEVLKHLEERNIIRRERIGEELCCFVELIRKGSGNLLKIGIIRSSEYGYIIPLRKILKIRDMS
jgi:Predicted transcriptional regulator